jgi:hypothetical protein
VRRGATGGRDAFVSAGGGGADGSALTLLLFNPMCGQRRVGGWGMCGGGASPPVQPVVPSWRRGRGGKCAEGEGDEAGDGDFSALLAAVLIIVPLPPCLSRLQT